MAFALVSLLITSITRSRAKAKNHRTCVPFRHGMQYVHAPLHVRDVHWAQKAGELLLHLFTLSERADLSGKKQPAHSLYIHVHGKDINSDGFIPRRLHFCYCTSYFMWIRDSNSSRTEFLLNKE